MNRTKTLHKIKELLYSPKTTINDLANVIAEDRDLSEKLIKLIKSYGFPPESWNLTSAIILLDFGTIRTIISDQLQQ